MRTMIRDVVRAVCALLGATPTDPTPAPGVIAVWTAEGVEYQASSR